MCLCRKTLFNVYVIVHTLMQHVQKTPQCSSSAFFTSMFPKHRIQNAIYVHLIIFVHFLSYFHFVLQVDGRRMSSIRCSTSSLSSEVRLKTQTCNVSKLWPCTLIHSFSREALRLYKSPDVAFIFLHLICVRKVVPCVIVEVEILHANSVLGLYGSSDSKTQVLIVQELFHDPVESSVWRRTRIQ